MKGHVPTPPDIVSQMVRRLFAHMQPQAHDRLLDPGCGDGAFIAGVLAWCENRRIAPPKIVGVELNPTLVAKARRRFSAIDAVEITHADYLKQDQPDTYRFIIGNPPYVALHKLDVRTRDRYRESFRSARGRFDLYMLFMEQAVRELRGKGRLVFITPEKYLYVDAASALRELLSKFTIESLDLLNENAFSQHTTYPVVTTMTKAPSTRKSRVRMRDGRSREARIIGGSERWWPTLMHEQPVHSGPTTPLGQLCLRISAGIATGADHVYVHPVGMLDKDLSVFSRPAMAGRDLNAKGTALPPVQRSLLIPYNQNGELVPESQLGALGAYLKRNGVRQRLERRTCARRKIWYAFHDNCPLPDILRPKLLCKDITNRPSFWLDATGTIVPLHTVYYIVPRKDEHLERLRDWLNGPETTAWLQVHAQRAANNFLRLQSTILKQIPIPSDLLS